MKSNPMKHFVDDCVDEDIGGLLLNAQIYQKYTEYKQVYGLPEISEEEIKNGLKYYCKNHLGIETFEKREPVNKVKVEDKNVIKMLGARTRVFTNIKITMSDEYIERRTEVFNKLDLKGKCSFFLSSNSTYRSRTITAKDATAEMLKQFPNVGLTYGTSAIIETMNNCKQECLAQ